MDRTGDQPLQREGAAAFPVLTGGAATPVAWWLWAPQEARSPCPLRFPAGFPCSLVLVEVTMHWDRQELNVGRLDLEWGVCRNLRELSAPRFTVGTWAL